MLSKTAAQFADNAFQCLQDLLALDFPCNRWKTGKKKAVRDKKGEIFCYFFGVGFDAFFKLQWVYSFFHVV